ncbi:TlpA disulfide reductase family protein [Gemmatimonas sp.]|jgi:cytochrome c biogenesis protein CcmG/thiol:disulfide interchange protein DsbE|uniref:TlpA disulfide reductase family protein n=1 Tax=Gemmatimonas sp. TaxID=1962908 RepID=UPI0037BF5B80
MTTFVRAGLIALLAGVSLSACERRTAPRAPALGAAAPAFTAMTLEGTPVTLAALSGSVVVLNVWATWCIPCREEIPQLEALHRQYGAQGLKTIGVSIDAAGMGADVRDFATEQGMTYPIWLDPDHQFSLKFLTVGVPETFVIDRAGVIRFRMIGAFRRGDTTLAAAVRRAMAS